MSRPAVVVPLVIIVNACIWACTIIMCSYPASLTDLRGEAAERAGAARLATEVTGGVSGEIR